jgi:hypothetical protein
MPSVLVANLLGVSRLQQGLVGVFECNCCILYHRAMQSDAEQRKHGMSAH